MTYTKQNDLLLNRLLEYYKGDNYSNMNKMLSIINGDSRISLRIVDWFATNYAKKHYTVYSLNSKENRFKVYNDYKLNLKAYSKKRFDPFCRWDRITIPYQDNKYIQTTIGQLNFFKWAIQNGVVKYIEDNYADIESDIRFVQISGLLKPLSTLIHHVSRHHQHTHGRKPPHTHAQEGSEPLN